MAKVIETNVSITNGVQQDFQSRVIEVESWSAIVEEVKSGKVVVRNSYIGHMMGTTMPKECTIQDLEYDKFHLSCLITRWDGMQSYKLLYLAEGE
jgi:hypothetical protein